MLEKGRPLLHLTLKTHYEDTFRRQAAPHCLATPHFPVTPHFGAALFGATLFGDATFSCDATFWRRIVWCATLFGDATLVGVTLHRWAWSWLEWFRLGVGSGGKNAPGTGCIFGSMVGPRLCRPSKLGWASWHILARWGERSAKLQIQNAVYRLKLSFRGRCCIVSLYLLYSHCIFILVSLSLIPLFFTFYPSCNTIFFSFHASYLKTLRLIRLCL